MKREQLIINLFISTIIICVLTVSCTSTITKEKEQILELGFNGSVGEPHPGDCIACYSNKTEFDIDEDITIKYSYGSLFGRSESNYPYITIKLFFFNNDIESTLDEIAHPDFNFTEANGLYFLKNIEAEKYYSDDYKITTEFLDEERIEKEYHYSHSENITLPKELLNKDNGRIVLTITEYNSNENYKIGSGGLALAYKIENDKIYLSS